MKYANDTLQDLSAVDADKTSEVVDIRWCYGCFVGVVWTSTTAAGVVKLQQSTDGVTWFDHATTGTINNNNSSIYWNIDGNHAGYFRVFIDYTSGTITTVKTVFGAKGI